MATDVTGRSRPGVPGKGDPAKGLVWRRLAWFIGIWAASAAAVIVFGWVVKKLIGI